MTVAFPASYSWLYFRVGLVFFLGAELLNKSLSVFLTVDLSVCLSLYPHILNNILTDNIFFYFSISFIYKDDILFFFLEELLEYLYNRFPTDPRIPALETRLSNLYNGIYDEDRFSNLETIIEMSRVRGGGGMRYPSFHKCKNVCDPCNNGCEECTKCRDAQTI